MDRACIVGVGMTPFGKFMDSSLRELSEKAVRAALADAGITAAELDTVYFGNAAAGLLTGQESVRGQVLLRHIGVQGKPIINVENACASSSTACYLAKIAIESGQARIALVVGAEKMYNEDRQLPARALQAATDLEAIDAFRRDIGSPADGSIFMDLYAHLARQYMARSGATEEDFAAIVVKSRKAGAKNPMAQFRTPVTAAEVLRSRAVSPPITLMMCSSIGDGAAALILMSETEARRRGLAAVKIRASVLMSGQGDLPNAVPVAQQAASRAYEQAGVGPKDLDVVELHDAAAPGEYWLYEQVQLAPVDGGLEFFRTGATGPGGRLAVNPSGGLLSRGHPIGATGAAQLVELFNQLRGRCADRQQGQARLALAENGGGWIGADAAATVVTLLEA